MPELPEVETISRRLRTGVFHPPITGRRILSARALWERSIAYPGPQEFEARLPGQTIRDTGRRGKFLILDLSESSLLIHLRMSGDIFVEPSGGPPEAGHRLEHDRVVFELEGGLRMTFNDMRKFGRLWLVPDPQMVLGSLGPEPLDENLTPEDFHRRLVSRRRLLKPLLMDQTFLAGLGNIYTDESLHLAKLHPLAHSAGLSFEQSARLLEAIRQTLKAGIERQGTSIDWLYRGGDYQKYLRAYGRADSPCPNCGTPIRRTVVGQRGTYYCPVCQPLERALPLSE